MFMRQQQGCNEAELNPTTGHVGNNARIDDQTGIATGAMHEALADRGLHRPIEGDVVVDICRVIAIEHACQLEGTGSIDLSPNASRNIIPGGGWDIRQQKGRTRIHQGCLGRARKAFLAKTIYEGYDVADSHGRPETSTRGWSG